MGIWIYPRREKMMRDVKIKLTVVMIVTTLILFLITFFTIKVYQKNYILNNAISALENEVQFLKNPHEEEELDYDRLFNVEVFPLDGVEQYYTDAENYFENLYQDADFEYDEIYRNSNEFGDYYIVFTFADDTFFRENPKKKLIPLVCYIDITASSNVVSKINNVFFILLIIIIIVEGLAGLYIGTKFEDSQTKLKHFFQNASHELKSPLMSIEGYAEGIKTGVIEDTQMASDIIIKKSRSMKVLIDEILTISKLDTNSYVLEEEIVDILDIIEESVDNFKPYASDKGIKFTLESNILNSEIKVDPLQMYKAINTVIDNAFKFSISEVMITVDEDKKYLYIHIYNDGENISEDNKQHIFERFYSKDNFSSGIGLSMAKEILNLHKGDIALENKDAGVLFNIKIPK